MRTTSAQSLWFLVWSIACLAVLANPASAADTTRCFVAGWQVVTRDRGIADDPAEQQIVIRAPGTQKPAWTSPWSRHTVVRTFDRSGVPGDLSWPDAIGDGSPNLYVQLMDDAPGYIGSLTILKLNTSTYSMGLPFKLPVIQFADPYAASGQIIGLAHNDAGHRIEVGIAAPVKEAGIGRKSLSAE